MTDLKAKLILQYELEMEVDFYLNDEGKNVVLKSGIVKIRRKMNIQIDHELVHVSDDNKCCIIKCTGTAKIFSQQDPFTKSIRTVDFGEVSPQNNSYEFPVAVAKKRAEGRVVLDLAGFTETGWMTEDEPSTSFEPTKKPSKDMVDNLEQKIEEKRSSGKKGTKAKKIEKEVIPKDIPDNAIVVDGIIHILEGEVDGRWIIYKVIDGKKEMTTCDDEKTFNKLVDLLKKKEDKIQGVTPPVEKNVKEPKSEAKKKPRTKTNAEKDVKPETIFPGSDHSSENMTDPEPETKEKPSLSNELIIVGKTRYALIGKQKDGKYLIAGKRGQSPIVEMYEDESAYNKRVDTLRESIDPEEPSTKEEEPEKKIEKIINGDVVYELWGKQDDGTYLIFGKKGKVPISARYDNEKEYNTHVAKLREEATPAPVVEEGPKEVSLEQEFADHFREKEEPVSDVDGVVETTLSATKMNADKVNVPKKITEKDSEPESKEGDQLDIDISPIADLTKNVIKL